MILVSGSGPGDPRSPAAGRTNRECSEAQVAGKPLEVARRSNRSGELADHEVAREGRYLGDWREAKRSRKRPRHDVVGRRQREPGGNCYNCHQMRREHAFGTIGPSLYRYGKLRGVADPTNAAASRSWSTPGARSITPRPTTPVRSCRASEGRILTEQEAGHHGAAARTRSRRSTSNVRGGRRSRSRAQPDLSKREFVQMLAVGTVAGWRWTAGRRPTRAPRPSAVRRAEVRQRHLPEHHRLPRTVEANLLPRAERQSRGGRQAAGTCPTWSAKRS